MKKILAAVASVAMLGVLFTACSSTGSSSSSSAAASSSSAESSSAASSSLSGTVTAAGSSALKPLVDVAKTDFQKLNPNVAITVSAGGSGTGLKQVAAGTVNIGNSDVAAETKLDAATAKTLVDHQVAIIGVAAITSTDVTVKNLTTAQLTSIFTGKTTNWKDVGGADEKITLITRPSNSGTRALFKKYAIGNANETSSSINTDDSGVLLKDVESNKGAIGYVALSYLVNKPSVNTVSIDGVEPTIDNIYAGKYNVYGTEHMYTKGEATGAVKAFIEYMQSSDFASNCEANGYGVASKVKTQH